MGHDGLDGDVQEIILAYANSSWTEKVRAELDTNYANDEPAEIHRGVYFEDPDGHFLEIITRPYGSG